MQIALFSHGLFFEVKQRRTLERKHGEGAFQDIRQWVAKSIAGPVVGKILKLSVEKMHQFVKCQILLKLLEFFGHVAKLHQMA
ncbi:MAG: hypothetical protein LC776_19380 [Acidobacteria bacterium]|nr:hypothetical protein [Acidobacteriota bacterium]